MQVSLQYSLAEFMTMLNYMYPKSFIHQSTLLPRKAPKQELEQKCVVQTLLFDCYNTFSHATGKPPFPIHAEQQNLLSIKISESIFRAA
jgi:hypothetical protein